jgi:hypothetical protein
MIPSSKISCAGRKGARTLQNGLCLCRNAVRDQSLSELRGSAMAILSTYWTDFIGRFDGPLHFRLFVQPLMAILFALRDGWRDAREGRNAYLWAILTDPAQRQYLLESGWKGISKVFVIAFVLDVVYQFMVWGALKPLQALLMATVLAVTPYALLRGPVNRVVRIGRT